MSQDLAHLYQYVFDAIELHFEKEGFPEQDKAQLHHIRASAEYSLGKPFSVDATSAGYFFTATSKEIKNYPEVAPFVAAHEVHHALQKEREKSGHKNTSHARTKWGDALQLCADKLAFHARSIDELDNSSQPNREESENHWRRVQHWIRRCENATSFFNVASQNEEFNGDSFALKVFPETDVEKFRKFLEDDKTDDDTPVLEDDDCEDSDIRTHPSQEIRLARLKQMKARLTPSF